MTGSSADAPTAYSQPPSRSFPVPSTSQPAMCDLAGPSSSWTRRPARRRQSGASWGLKQIWQTGKPRREAPLDSWTGWRHGAAGSGDPAGNAMRRFGAALLLATLAGCATGPMLDNPIRVGDAVPAACENPILIYPARAPGEGYAEVFDRVLDVVDDYFPIAYATRY